MMSSSAMLKLTHDKMVIPQKPTMKSVFSGKNISHLNINNKTNNNKIKMVKAHSKSREELKKMKVKALRSMVKEHNLHNQIKKYTTMKKAELVEALMKHSSAKGGASPAAAEAPVKKGRGRPKKADALVPPAAPKKKGKKPKSKAGFEAILEDAKGLEKKKKGKKKLMPMEQSMRGKRPRGRPKRYIDEV